MRVLMKNPNFLILDEPTNDLDIDTLNVLEEFLEKYNGVLLLVSHDRYLMDRLTNQLFILEGEGFLDIYAGNYTDYRLEKEEEAKKPLQSRNEVEKKEKTTKSKLSFKEEKELESLETEIPELEIRVRQLSQQLNNTLDHIELTEISKQIEEQKNKIDSHTLRWLELIELKEQ